MAYSWYGRASRFQDLPPQRTELPDATVIIRGRLQRRSHGRLEVPFAHRFAEPESVVVTVSPNSYTQAGFIETVVEIEADNFTVESLNAHPTGYFFSWIAIGR